MSQNINFLLLKRSVFKEEYMSSDLLFEVNSEVLQHLADIDTLLLEISSM